MVGRVADLAPLSSPSLVLTVCVSQSRANAKTIHKLRKQLVWVSVRWAREGTRTSEDTLSGVWGPRPGTDPRLSGVFSWRRA